MTEAVNRWYFDFISPFAYLQWPKVRALMTEHAIVPVPILCSVTFGAPIRVEPGEERRPFLDRARLAVMALRDI